MANEEKTFPPVAGRAERALARYQAAEGFIDKALVVIMETRYTLLALVAWSGLMVWLGAKVFGC